MKIFLSLIIVLTSCTTGPHDRTNKSTSSDTSSIYVTPIESSMDRDLRIAKELADTIFYYVDQGDSKKMTVKEAKKIANPLQKKLDSIRLLLNAFQIKELDQHTLTLINGVVDRKLEREK